MQELVKVYELLVHEFFNKYFRQILILMGISYIHNFDLY
jgi:hypothetical protein